MDRRFLTWAGYAVAGIATVLSSALFYYDTREFWKSIAAGVITGGLVLGTYMILRWLILASRS